ncbi:3-oxoacyl-ACP synthase [Tellurirhabdus bombi]|uniref:3-oxoacyl-ACP synthase n=1 Tax=Tellurirhabdus bombi TaxID=2907205 RepID=UPI00286E8D38|nr:3-oxoacyl-ACP synthase [Tellurirhabdus bombi]
MMNSTPEIKTQLYQHCLDYVDQRISTAQTAMKAAQAAANEESKSSAGDKYETTRAMMQIERDQCARQLTEALKLRQELAGIDLDKTFPTVQPGSLVLTNRGTFFLGISIGKININQDTFLVVSAASPIGSQLLGRRVGDEISFNKVAYRILQIA